MGITTYLLETQLCKSAARTVVMLLWARGRDCVHMRLHPAGVLPQVEANRPVQFRALSASCWLEQRCNISLSLSLSLTHMGCGGRLSVEFRLLTMHICKTFTHTK